MENIETNENNNTPTMFDIKSKLQEIFDEKILKMEEKFPNDYEILRGYSIEFTECFHEFQDNIYPIVLDVLNPKKINQSLDLTKSTAETPGKKLDRSRTPVRNSKQITKKEEIPVDKNNQTQKLPPRDRAKTPGPIKDSSSKILNKKDLKKDTENITTKSTNLLPTLKNSKKEIDIKNRTIDAKPEKENFVKKKDVTTKQPPKRDLTPTPFSKKGALDISHISQDDVKEKEINNIIKNYQTKKASVKEMPKDDRLYHTNKRPTVSGLTDKSKTEKTQSESSSKSKRGSTGSVQVEKKVIRGERKDDSTIINEENGGTSAKEIQLEKKQSELIVSNETQKNDVTDQIQNEKVSEFNDNSNPTCTVNKNSQTKPHIVDLSNKKQKKFSFSNKFIECLYLASNNILLDEKLRLSISLSVREIYGKFGVKNILQERIKNLDGQLNKYMENPLAKYLDNASLESLIVKQFTPSKTAQNGLNFVTKDEENNLCKKEQSEEILNVFRLVYILLNEPYSQITPQKMIENLLTVVFEKISVENLKSLFLNHISKRTDLDENQFQQIETILRDNPKILSSPDLLKINRCVSYMTFILKEVCEYVCAKTPDETPLFAIRNLNRKISATKEKLDKLNSILNNSK